MELEQLRFGNTTAVDKQIRHSTQIVPCDSLEDRIRDGMAGGLLDRLAIAKELAAILVQRHRKALFHPQLRTASVLLDINGKVQVSGAESVDTAHANSDTRAFGFILYELLVGEISFAGDYPPGIPDMEPLYKAGISAGLVHAVSSCTSIESSPKDLVRALHHIEHVLKDSTHQAQPPRQRKMIYWFGAIVFALAVVSLLYLRGH